MGEKYAQMFVTSELHETVDPMKTMGEAGEKLNSWVYRFGIPDLLVTDNAKAETYGTWGAVTKKYLIPQRWMEPGSPWQNRAEDAIGEWKKHYRRIMHRRRVPEALWNFGARYTTRV